MLDLAGLPKNANGFRTTHTCELCGFEPKTKNKYREKQDHLVMKHFKERIDKIFPHCRPYSCPNVECEFTGKDKQALLRHYTGKHGILELFLKEELAARGIHYNLSDSAKRKSMGGGEQRKAKEARLSPELSHTILPELSPSPSPIMAADTTAILPTEFDFGEPLTTQYQPPPRLVSDQLISLPLQARLLPQVPTTKLPSMSTVFHGTVKSQPTKQEVEAMLASYELDIKPCPPTIQTSLSSISSISSLPLDSHVVSSTTLDNLDLFLPTSPENKSSKLMGQDTMWGGGVNGLFSSECAQTVPYLDTTGLISIGDFEPEFDYLYPATVEPLATSYNSMSITQIHGGGERLIPFGML